MSDYDDKMFGFLTQEENLEGLILAKNQFPDVRKRLISEFWIAVKSKLDAEKPNDFEIYFELDRIEKTNSKLSLYKKGQDLCEINSLPSIAISFENLNGATFYGIFVNNESKSIKIKEGIEKLSALPLKDFKKEDNWYPLWKYDSELDFFNDQSLMNIIPSKRDEKANSCAQTLIELAKETESIVDEILILGN